MVWIILGGVLCALVFQQFGWTGESMVGCLFVIFLLILSRIDLRERRLPDKIVLPGLAVFLLLRLFIHPVYSITESLVGMVIGFVVFLVIGLVSRGGLAGGDIKLYAVVGVVLGAYLVILSMPVFILFGLIGFILQARHLKDRVAYGPSIAAAALVTYLYGDDIFNHFLLLNSKFM